MCTVCGCSSDNVSIESLEENRRHDHHGHTHDDHSHDDHGHHHGPRISSCCAQQHQEDHDTHYYGQGPARAHAPGLSQARMVQIETDILSKNDNYAARNRARLYAANVLCLNLVSSPGAGKTTLLTETIKAMGDRLPVTVIEGDQQTANDAQRIRDTGVRALQINTGKGCHLDAHMVGHALDELAPPSDSVLFIENVGNLVCPAAFDLGEQHKVAILSVTEGEDKPIKYPDMFAASDLMILSKIDLLPHLNFDVDACVQYARRVNPGIRVLKLSSTTGEGMDTWIDWIANARPAAQRSA